MKKNAVFLAIICLYFVNAQTNLIAQTQEEPLVFAEPIAAEPIRTAQDLALSLIHI